MYLTGWVGSRMLRQREDGWFETERSGYAIKSRTVMRDCKTWPRLRGLVGAMLKCTMEELTPVFFKGRAIFDNPGSDDQRKLLPGQYVPLYLTVGHRPDTQLIPQAALLQTQEGSYVWVIDEHDTAQRRVVTIGPAYQGYWMVREGLKTGERVVSEGVQKIRKSGMPVRVATAPSSSPR